MTMYWFFGKKTKPNDRTVDEDDDHDDDVDDDDDDDKSNHGFICLTRAGLNEVPDLPRVVGWGANSLECLLPCFVHAVGCTRGQETLLYASADGSFYV